MMVTCLIHSILFAHLYFQSFYSENYVSSQQIIQSSNLLEFENYLDQQELFEWTNESAINVNYQI